MQTRVINVKLGFEYTDIRKKNLPIFQHSWFYLWGLWIWVSNMFRGTERLGVSFLSFSPSLSHTHAPFHPTATVRYILKEQGKEKEYRSYYKLIVVSLYIHIHTHMTSIHHIVSYFFPLNCFICIQRFSLFFGQLTELYLFNGEMKPLAFTEHKIYISVRPI